MSKPTGFTSGNKNPLVKLEADLKKALGFMGDNSRKAAGLAVRATLEFTHAHPHLTSQGLTRPLYALLSALDDLDKGRVAPMLEPAYFGNRPPIGNAQREARAHASFCVDQLIGTGESLEVACKAVAKIWTQCRREVPSNFVAATWKSIKYWSDRISKLPDDDTQRVILEVLRKQFNVRPELRDMSNDEILSMLKRTLKVLAGPDLE